MYSFTTTTEIEAETPAPTTGIVIDNSAFANSFDTSIDLNDAFQFNAVDYEADTSALQFDTSDLLSSAYVSADAGPGFASAGGYASVGGSSSFVSGYSYAATNDDSSTAYSSISYGSDGNYATISDFDFFSF